MVDPDPPKVRVPDTVTLLPKVVEEPVTVNVEPMATKPPLLTLSAPPPMVLAPLETVSPVVEIGPLT